jgi:RNA polymerase sigma-70 factor, ECF subfamily
MSVNHPMPRPVVHLELHTALRDVLGFSARETAQVLETTPVSVDSALQRAHKAVDERLPSQSQQQTLRLVGDDEVSQLVERYVAAWERNDVDAVVSMLAEDARLVMPPLPTWVSGREQVAAFLRAYPLSGAGAGRWFPRQQMANPRSRPTAGTSRQRRSCRTA